MENVEVREPIDTRKHPVSMAPKKISVRPNIVIEKPTLSENIQRFDRKVLRRKQVNPFAYNSVIESQKENNISVTPTAENMIVNETYNSIGKMLGVDTKREWNLYYDKIYKIVEWVQLKTKTDKFESIVKYINDKLRTVPTMGSKRIDDLFIYTKLNK